MLNLFGNSVSVRLGRLHTVSFSVNYQPEKMSTKAPLSRKLWLHDDVIKIQRSKANIFEGTSCAFFIDWIFLIE